MILERAIPLVADLAKREFEKANKISGMHEGYIKHTVIDISGGVIKFTTDWQTEDGAPIDVFLNRGTKGHYIYPKDKKALHWNEDYFSKGHFVKGIKERNVSEKTIQGIKENVNAILQEGLR